MKSDDLYLSLNSVKKSYGHKLALNNVNMSLREGQILTIVGPVGAGKTTTLKIIAGLEDVTSGEVLFQGQVINNREPWERGFAMVFETYALYPHKSVYENIASSLRIMNMNEEEIDRRVNDVARLLQMLPYLKRRPVELSGGQRQRVAIGRALAKPAKLYLLDEPIAHLDAKLRHHMVREFEHLQRSEGLSMVYVTNNWQEALSLGDNIAVLREGEVVQFGTKELVFQQPANTFVASLFGDPPMNLIPGDVTKDAGGTFFEINKGERIHIYDSIAPQKAVLGVRPSKISIELDGGNGVKSEVYSVERLELRFVVSLRVNDRIYKVVVEKVDPSIQVGKQVRMLLNLDGACIFNEQGELIKKLEGADE